MLHLIPFQSCATKLGRAYETKIVNWIINGCLLLFSLSLSSLYVTRKRLSFILAITDVVGDVAYSRKTKKIVDFFVFWTLDVGWCSTWPGACTPVSTLDLMKFSTFSKWEETIRNIF
jgi:hypothetical protein